MIVSSPLILSHDVNNETVSEAIWDIVANSEAIAVNQAYEGDSGGLFEASEQLVQLNDIFGWQAYPGTDNPPKMVEVWVPSSQFLSKPVGEGKVAVLLLNSDNQTSHLTLRFSTIPETPCDEDKKCHVRDLWNHENLGEFQGSWSTTVEPHDSAFILLEAATARTVSPSKTSNHPSFKNMKFLLTSTVIGLLVILLCSIFSRIRGRNDREYKMTDALDADGAQPLEQETLGTFT